jgi:hypothetical protein
MSGDNNTKRAPLSVAGWLALIVLFGFLAAAIVYAVYGWGAIATAHVSTFGWIALGVGSAVTILVGGGLMALVFYSSRHDYDR